MKDYKQLKPKPKQFSNYIPMVRISGKYVGRNITELDLGCATQVCGTYVDFFPHWNIEGNKIVLTLTPKLTNMDSEDAVEMTIFEGKEDFTLTTGL